MSLRKLPDWKASDQDFMFRHRQQLRRWAARVLLVWLFGVGTGVAHACLSSNPAQPSGPAAAHATGEVMAHHGAAAVAQPLGSAQAQADEGAPGEQGPAARSSCVDYCEKASIQACELAAIKLANSLILRHYWKMIRIKIGIAVRWRAHDQAV